MANQSIIIVIFNVVLLFRCLLNPTFAKYVGNVDSFSFPDADFG